jgi:hypothetical protein
MPSILWKRILTWLDSHSSLITAIFTVVLAMSTTLLWRTTRQARIDTLRSIAASEQLAGAAAEANRQAKDSSIRQERPWITVDATIVSDLIYDSRTGDASVTVLFTMQNVGRSPAVDADIVATVYVTTAERNQPLVEQKKVCDEARTRKKPPQPYNFGEIIFPGGTAYAKRAFSIPKSEIEKSYAYSHSQWLDMTLVGCVDYRFTFEGEHHQTGLVRGLLKESNQKPGHFVSFNYDEGDVPAVQLRFRRDSYGSYAD